MILRRSERHHIAAVAQRDEADFLAAQKLFDHQTAGQSGERGFRFGAVVGDDDALAGGQTVGLQHHRKSEAIERAAGFGGVLDRDDTRPSGYSFVIKSSLRNILLPSSCAAARLGPTIFMPRARNSSTTPATSGASGPTTVRSAADVLGQLR